MVGFVQHKLRGNQEIWKLSEEDGAAQLAIKWLQRTFQILNGGHLAMNFETNHVSLNLLTLVIQNYILYHSSDWTLKAPNSSANKVFVYLVIPKTLITY